MNLKAVDVCVIDCGADDRPVLGRLIPYAHTEEDHEREIWQLFEVVA